METTFLEELLAVIVSFTTLGSYAALTGLPFFLLIGIIGVLLLIAIAIYVLTAIPLYKMAKKAGIPHAWLAWIPYGNTYIMLLLCKREFNIFNWIKTYDRTKVFWGYLIGALGWPLATWLLGCIPILNILVSVISPLLSLAFYAALAIFTWRMHYDLYMTYGMKDNAMLLSILSCFVPLMSVVLLYVMMNKEPDYTV